MLNAEGLAAALSDLSLSLIKCGTETKGNGLFSRSAGRKLGVGVENCQDFSLARRHVATG